MSRTAFVSGAAGFIGARVARALRDDGFYVFALVRSAEKAESSGLVGEEIEFIIGDSDKPESYAEQIAQADIIVECAPVDASAGTLGEAVKNPTSADGSKKLYIYTTGFQTYAHEEKALATPELHVAVVRPSFTFGGSGGGAFKSTFFNKPATAADLKIEGDPKRFWPWVSIQDLVRGFVLLANHSDRTTLRGNTFRFGKLDPSLTYERIAIASAKAMGVLAADNDGSNIPRVEPAPYTFPSFVNFSVTEFDGSAAKDILGWEPRISSEEIITDTERYYKSFLAWNRS